MHTKLVKNQLTFGIIAFESKNLACKNSMLDGIIDSSSLNLVLQQVDLFTDNEEFTLYR